MMDVASLAGVSQATVSLVLNGTPGARLSDATKKKVRQAAEDIGYRLARREQRHPAAENGVIAFIADEVATDPWMSLAFDGARAKALEFGLTTCLYVLQGDAASEKILLDQLAEQLSVRRREAAERLSAAVTRELDALAHELPTAVLTEGPEPIADPVRGDRDRRRDDLGDHGPFVEFVGAQDREAQQVEDADVDHEPDGPDEAEARELPEQLSHAACLASGFAPDAGN